MALIDDTLQRGIAEALERAQQEGALPAFEIPDSIPVERPKYDEMGDYATPLCLQLARVARMNPLKIAEVLAAHLPSMPFLAAAEVAPPGYVNFRLSESWLAEQVDAVLEAGEAFGCVNVGHSKRVQVEFVSANPTGPLHMGSARNAVLGDTLARVLEAAGYDVQREYYVNDAGSRMRVFYETLYARYAQALGRDEQVPEDGYHGQHMVAMGESLAKEVGDRYLNVPREKAIAAVGEWGLARVLDKAREDLERLGITYDRWFHESTLYEDGAFERVMDILRRGGYLSEHDGAIWFDATRLGGDKDEVIIRSDGSPGYFASDIAYHYDKFVGRGFDQVIDVWGADHQGHAPRMFLMLEALGLDPARLTIIIYQLVTLKRGGEIVRLSKRTGDMITLREVEEEVGADAMRFFLTARSADSQMDFDLDLARAQSDENPVYYVQYAHARICSILRYAESLDSDDGDVSLLTHPSELALIRQMLRLPEFVRTAAEGLAPHYLAYYAQELASAFHAFYRDCRVVSSDPADAEISKARLKLVAACRMVLRRVLALMGMSAPEVM
ncbi:MAG: arginine--tRNA ligase [Anaerolineae bacterium]